VNRVHNERPEQTGARDELASLCEGFFDNLAWLSNCELVVADQIPPEIRRMLVHGEHMTATLKRHYQQPVALRVLDHHTDGETYRRKILLTVDEGKRVVEFGIVRMKFAALDDAAREVVLSRETPLGEIFERFDVLTKVEPRGYLRFTSDTPIVQCFGPATAAAYGRLGVIHCNGEPAVELLEVVPA
jgi:chorismate-pyruvate lyase